MEIREIREIREAARLSQQQLADLLGVTRQTVGGWESGKHAPPEYYLEKLKDLGIIQEGAAMTEKPEQPSTYFVEDRTNKELRRVSVQSQSVSDALGGVLLEQADPARFRRVLDVGCGTGNWLIQVAITFPDIQQLIGVDISHAFITHARTQAKAAGVSDRVEFHEADALLPLEFPDNSFDLVNHRFAVSWLRTWDWPKVLREYCRVCQPGGVTRITEYNGVGRVERAPAMERFNRLTASAFYQSGHYFTPDGEDMAGDLTRLLTQHGMQEVYTRSCQLVKSGADEEQWQALIEGISLAFQNILPFLRKWGKVPDDYEEMCQQALLELEKPDCVTTWDIVTAWGLR